MAKQNLVIPGREREHRISQNQDNSPRANQRLVAIEVKRGPGEYGSTERDECGSAACPSDGPSSMSAYLHEGRSWTDDEYWESRLVS
jgi:hypothetical protein